MVTLNVINSDSVHQWIFASQGPIEFSLVLIPNLSVNNCAIFFQGSTWINWNHVKKKTDKNDSHKNVNWDSFSSTLLNPLIPLNIFNTSCVMKCVQMCKKCSKCAALSIVESDFILRKQLNYVNHYFLWPHIIDFSVLLTNELIFPTRYVLWPPILTQKFWFSG